MRKFYVYDCTARIGVACRLRGPEWLAHLIAWGLSKVTRRFHDYSFRAADAEPLAA